MATCGSWAVVAMSRVLRQSRCTAAAAWRCESPFGEPSKFQVIKGEVVLTEDFGRPEQRH